MREECLDKKQKSVFDFFLVLTRKVSLYVFGLGQVAGREY